MSGTTGYLKGDVSSSVTLTSGDHLYEQMINESRESNLSSFVVGTTSNCQYSCDGTADDVQIQAALTAANVAGGGIVFVKEGTYDISAVLVISSNTTLTGGGWSTILKLANSSNKDMFYPTSGSTNIFIENLQIDMNQANNTTSTGRNAIRCVSLTNSVIENIYLHDMAWDAGTTNVGIGLLDCTNVVVRNNYLSYVPDYGIAAGGINQCQIINNYIHNAKNHGIGLTLGTGVAGRNTKNNVSGNIIYFDSDSAGSADGIKLDKTDDSIFSNNVIYTDTGATAPGYHGIMNSADDRAADGAANSFYCDRNTYSNNLIYNFRFGLWLKANREFSVTNNYVYVPDYGGDYAATGLFFDYDERNDTVEILCDRGKIIGNTVIYPTVTTLGAGSAFTFSKGNYTTINGNFIYNAPVHGMVIGGSSGLGGTSGTPIGMNICNNTILNSGDNGIFTTTMTYSNVNNNTLIGNGRITDSRLEIHLFNSLYNTVIGNQSYSTGVHKARWGIGESGTSDYNIISNNIAQGATTANILKLGANSIARNNIGWATEASGTAQIANTKTAGTVTHGLAVTPTVDDIAITLAENPTNTPGAIWVDSLGATTFVVNCESDPGTSNLDFGWRAQVL